MNKDNNLTIFNTIRDSIKNGDCLFFSGKSRSSNLIKYFTKGEFSHVALSIWLEMPYQPKSLYIIESTTLNNVADLSQEFKKGVQIVRLDQRLAAYDGECWIKPLKNELVKEKEQSMISWLFQKYIQKTQYDSIGALGAAVDKESDNRLARIFANIFGFNNKEEFSKLFCSEMVTKAYKEAGLLPQDMNASEILPDECWKFPFLGPEIKLI